METVTKMVHHDSWVRVIWEHLVASLWHNKTHRIMLYIALIVTLILGVEVLDLSLVGR